MAKNLESILLEELNKTLDAMAKQPELFAVHKGDFTRNRVLDFKTVIRTILGMQESSLIHELESVGIDATTSAFVQARAKLKLLTFSYLMKEMNKHIPVNNLYNGYRLLAIDGSTFSTPRNKNSKYHFDKHIKQNGVEYKGYNQGHLHALFDVLNKIFVDVSFTTRGVGEREKARWMLSQYDGRKAIITADRGYYSYDLIETVNRNPRLEYVFRTSNKNSFKEINELPMKELDKDVEITVSTLSQNLCNLRGYRHIDGPSPYGKKKQHIAWHHKENVCTIRYRIVRFRINEDGPDEYETIITSLDRFQFSPEDIKELYRMRWGIETAFRDLKHVVGALYFHGKKDTFVEQEIYARLLMYNLTTAIAMSVAIAKSHCKYEYRISFSYAIRACYDFFRSKGVRPPPDDLRARIAKQLVAVRPGRKNERKIVAHPAIPFNYRAA